VSDQPEVEDLTPERFDAMTPEERIAFSERNMQRLRDGFDENERTISNQRLSLSGTRANVIGMAGSGFALGASFYRGDRGPTWPIWAAVVVSLVFNVRSLLVLRRLTPPGEQVPPTEPQPMLARIEARAAGYPSMIALITAVATLAAVIVAVASIVFD
jgi:hypothetical protein